MADTSLQNSPGIGSMKNAVVRLKSCTRYHGQNVIEGSRRIAVERYHFHFRIQKHDCWHARVPFRAVPPTSPRTWSKANCIPSGFMVPNGWDIVVDYYKNIDQTTRWVPWRSTSH
ncbi:hypothetical protein IV203_020141 [Nitzschia inconspicua]|uniref:Uncharacterized protein n=1 Tax=Nitzschia inconspicua TaxID=303405 RepID=A0A9K3M271_9STRA|nr:hypothetical protein IV203_020141 [Nitzschia inconspicua]